jgi:hypothetical protein
VSRYRCGVRRPDAFRSAIRFSTRRCSSSLMIGSHTALLTTAPRWSRNPAICSRGMMPRSVRVRHSLAADRADALGVQPRGEGAQALVTQEPRDHGPDHRSLVRPDRDLVVVVAERAAEAAVRQQVG